MSKKSKWEQMLFDQLVLGGLMLNALCEYSFDSDRDWRFDFAWPDLRIAAEVDGGNRMAVINKRTGMPVAVGRHTLSTDYTKRNAATAQGWRVFAFTPEMIKSGEAFGTMQDVLLPF